MTLTWNLQFLEDYLHAFTTMISSLLFFKITARVGTELAALFSEHTRILQQF